MKEPNAIRSIAWASAAVVCVGLAACAETHEVTEPPPTEPVDCLAIDQPVLDFGAFELALSEAKDAFFHWENKL